MGKTLRQRNRKHRKHNKSKKGGILSLENSNKVGMKQLGTGPRRSSSPKPIRKTKTPDNQRTQIQCMRLLINGIKTGNQWEQFLKCKNVNLDDIVKKFPTGESWIANLDDMNLGREEREKLYE